MLKYLDGEGDKPVVTASGTGKACITIKVFHKSRVGTLSGRSFSEIAEKLDRTKADALRAAFANAEAKINAIPAPFDQTILNNTAPVAAAIDAVKLLGDRLDETGKAIGAEF